MLKMILLVLQLSTLLSGLLADQVRNNSVMVNILFSTYISVNNYNTEIYSFKQLQTNFT